MRFTGPGISERSSLLSLRDLLRQVVQEGTHFGIGVFGLADLAACVHNGRMVAPAQVAADFFEAVFGQISRQVHTNLARLGNTLAPLFALQIGKTNIEMTRYNLGNIRNTYML